LSVNTLANLLAAGIIFIGGKSVGLFSHIPWITVIIWAGLVLLYAAVLFAVLVGAAYLSPHGLRISREVMRIGLLEASKDAHWPPDKRAEFEKMMETDFGDRWNVDDPFVNSKMRERFKRNVLSAPGNFRREVQVRLRKYRSRFF
jgi:hypothetical protein